MYTITINTDDNFKKLLKKADGLSAELRKALERALVKSVIHLHSAVLGSGRVPYKSGTLRRSILPFYNGLSGSGDSPMDGGVGTDVKYAPIHEFGLAVKRTSAWGRKTKPFTAQYKERAFLRVPFQQEQPFIEREFHDEIEKGMALQ